MKHFLALVVYFSSFIPSSLGKIDVIDELSAQFKQGNAKEIAKYFAPSVELIIIDQEDVYNKAQSEQILRDFFVKNTPQKSVIIHRLSTNSNYRLGIFTLYTKTGKFRVTLTMVLKKPSNNFLITELRIESDKE